MPTAVSSYMPPFPATIGGSTASARASDLPVAGAISGTDGWVSGTPELLGQDRLELSARGRELLAEQELLGAAKGLPGEGTLETEDGIWRDSRQAYHPLGESAGSSSSAAGITGPQASQSQGVVEMEATVDAAATTAEGTKVFGPEGADGHVRLADESDAGRESEPEEKAGVAPGTNLSPEEEAQVEQLKARDREVRTHEQAHAAAGGSHVRGGISYEYATGPDGRRYAVGGEVSIDTSAVAGDPQATILKAQQVRRAALAPAQPSAADRQAAAAASRMEAEARRQLLEQRSAGVTEAAEDAEPATTELGDAPEDVEETAEATQDVGMLHAQGDETDMGPGATPDAAGRTGLPEPEAIQPPEPGEGAKGVGETQDGQAPPEGRGTRPATSTPVMRLDYGGVAQTGMLLDMVA